MAAPDDVFVGWFPPDTLTAPTTEGTRTMIDRVQAALDHWAQGDQLSEPCPRAWRESHFVAAIVNAILACENTMRRASPYGGQPDLSGALNNLPATAPPPPPSTADAPAAQPPAETPIGDLLEEETTP